MRLGTTALSATLLLGPWGPTGLVAQEVTQEMKAQQLQEAFQKGPITLRAKVVRKVEGQDRDFPLFQVPILQAGDRLQLAFTGEAFDRRVTTADWSVVVVFLPRTVAPTEQGVVDGRLELDKEGRMALKELVAPYDAAPLIFLVPDKGGRKKILTDLNSHLESFRAICLKITDLSEARLHADRFLKGLEALDRNQNPAEYDSSLLNFMNLYGDWVSKDLQLLLNKKGGSNLEKYQLVAQEFRRAAVLVPAMQADQIVKVELPQVVATSPASAYVAIAFDLGKMVQNLWPGHKFRYIPALARDFRGLEADLYYGEWIRTTGTPRGALVCSPCRWEDATPPAFEFNLAPDASLMAPNTLLGVQVKSRGLSPFALYGHDWKLAFEDATLPPLVLTPSPGRQGFVVNPGPALQLLRERKARTVRARIQGRWGHQLVQSEPAALILDVDPTWQPLATETARFQVGQEATFRLPAPWATAVARVLWRPADASRTPLVATLKAQPDGSRLAVLQTQGAQPGEGRLEVHAHGHDLPSLIRPLLLLGDLPEVKGLTLHRGEAEVAVTGTGLQAIATIQAGPLRFIAKEGAWVAAAPVDQRPGTITGAAALLQDGRSLPLPALTILPPRPRLLDPEVMPTAPVSGVLPILSGFPMAGSSQTLNLALHAAPGTRFALGRPPQVQVRNAEDPLDARAVPAPQIRAIGNGQRLLVGFVPAQLLPGKATGKLEVRIQDEKLGASPWKPLPLTFLDLPRLATWKQDGPAHWLAGEGLELIEGFSASAKGPFQRAPQAFLEGQSAAQVPTPGPDGRLHFRLFGWPDLDLWFQGAPAPAPTPTPAPPPTPAPEAKAPTQAPTPAPGPVAPPSAQTPTVQPPTAPAVASPSVEPPKVQAPEAKGPTVKTPEVKAPEVQAPRPPAPPVPPPPVTPPPVVPPPAKG